MPRSDAVARVLPLLREVNDLKRVRAAHLRGTFSAEAFRRAWGALAAGEDPAVTARREAAGAVAAARLGAVDGDVLRRAGLSDAEAAEVLGRGFDEFRAVVDPALEAALGTAARRGDAPAFVDALEAQPRAGATKPGRPRIMLEPPESHADHCWAVAVYAVLLAPAFGAEPTRPFLAGLAHHFHNAGLPDSGFTGEMLLGPHLQPVMERLTRDVLDTLPRDLKAQVEDARTLLPHADTPEARAFHAADAIDRVLQMDHYARVARFELRDALVEMELVHEGPLQAFQAGVLDAAGLTA
jgi:5'-deoxynucleotidase YfbR-like HD superfamily hydrolase